MPDADMQIVDNDMNSWQQVNAGTLNEMKQNGYYMYRASLTPFAVHRQKGGVIQMRQVYGKAGIWVNGKKLGTKDTDTCADWNVTFPAVGDEVINIRVILKAKKVRKWALERPL